MSIIDKILNLFQSDKAKSLVLTPEIEAMISFRKDLLSLQEKDIYIARSDYSFLHNKYFDTYTFFENTKRANALSYYCQKNGLDKNYVNEFLSEYNDVCLSNDSSIIAKHNKRFIKNHLIEEQNYLDNILSSVDPNIKLDDEQKQVVL